MKLTNLLFFFFFFTSILAQEVTDKISYTFHWGELESPIQTEESGDHYVEIFTNLSTLKEAIDQPISVQKNEMVIDLESFGITVYNPKAGKPANFLKIDNYNPKQAAKSHGYQELGHLILPSSQLFLFNIKTKDDFTFRAQITVGQPPHSFNPTVKLPKVPKGDVYEFQVVSFEEEKTILRIDTLNEAKKHIVEIYSNPEKYEIIHIPNFKTTRRLVGDVDLIKLDVKPVSLINDLPVADVSFLNVPEFSNYSNKNHPFILEWGTIKNIDFEEVESESGIQFQSDENRFTPEEILDAIGNPLLLSLGYQDFEILKMRVSLIPESGIPTSFITNHLNYPEIENAIENIPNHTVILFDEIFIKNKDGDPTFLPPALRFIIE